VNLTALSSRDFRTCDRIQYAQTYQILAINGTFRGRGVITKGDALVLIDASIPTIAKVLVLDSVQKIDQLLLQSTIDATMQV